MNGICKDCKYHHFNVIDFLTAEAVRYPGHVCSLLDEKISKINNITGEKINYIKSHHCSWIKDNGRCEFEHR